MLLHKLVWALETEEKPGEAEFNPEVKRSGWQPPSDNGLWTPCATLKSQILNHLPDASRAYFEAEHGTFQQVRFFVFFQAAFIYGGQSTEKCSVYSDFLCHLVELSFISPAF